MWHEKTVTEMYEDKGDGSCFLKENSGEGLNFIVLMQEESFLYCEYRRPTMGWAW